VTEPLGVEKAFAPPMAETATPEIEAPSSERPKRALRVYAGLLRKAGAQTKLTVGSADDSAEADADATAQQVVAVLDEMRRHQQSDPPAPEAGAGHAAAPAAAPVARLTSARLARTATGAVGAAGGELDADSSDALQRLRGGGRALPGDVQRSMGSAFGADFSGVRVHEGAETRALSEHMNASAFTLGRDVFFRDGLPDASTRSGQHLLAHELTHTVQQGAAPTLRRNTDLLIGSHRDAPPPTTATDVSAPTDAPPPERQSLIGAHRTPPLDTAGGKVPPFAPGGRPEGPEAPKGLLGGHRRPPDPFVRGETPEGPRPARGLIGQQRTFQTATRPIGPVAPPSTGMLGAARDPNFADRKLIREQAAVVKAKVASAKKMADGAEPKVATAAANLDETTKKKTAAEAAKTFAETVWASDKPTAGQVAASTEEDALRAARQAKSASDAAIQERDAATAMATTATTDADEATVAYQKMTAAAGRIGGEPMSQVLEAAASVAIGDLDKIRATTARDQIRVSADATPALVTAANTAASDSGKALRLDGGPAALIGTLQQQLNATRADGAPFVSITGTFKATTETAVRAFQTASAITVTGRADYATWQALQKSGKAGPRYGDTTATRGEGVASTDNWWTAGSSDHDFMLKKGQKGVAVKELQQRLNNWLTPQKKKTLWVDGTLGSKTVQALREFCATTAFAYPAKVSDGDYAINGEIWALVKNIGGKVTTGRIEADTKQEVTGLDYVVAAHYDWKVSGNKMLVTVKMKFVDGSGQPLPSKAPAGQPSLKVVADWLKFVSEIWNEFAAVNTDPTTGKKKKVLIDFAPKAVNSGEDATIAVFPQGAGTVINAGEYEVGMRKGTAPHEFGHLIGMDDEYNRREEAYEATTGMEPTVGRVSHPSGKTAKTYADEIWAEALAAVAAADDPSDPTDATDLAAVTLVRGKLDAVKDYINGSLDQDAFSRQVDEEFAAAHGQKIVDWVHSLVNALTPTVDAQGLFDTVGGGQSDQWSLRRSLINPISYPVLAPFLISGKSTMAGEEAINTPADAGHDHPIDPRHVRPFVRLVAQAKGGGVWEPERR
jgi:peptidoglycan hydrolase-like protein with peptidoglycan-binding domain